ncbi:unnamed protein product [Rotaria sp. Silwood2]|nr:unnamed protein product [Rotaria sp. Silwood2]
MISKVSCQSTEPSSSSCISSTLAESTNRRFRRRIFENFLLIWLYPDLDESSNDYRDAMAQLRCIMNTIETFLDLDECLDFLTEINDDKVFMIISATHIQQILPLIHDTPQLEAIYVFCHNNKCKYEQLIQGWPKVKGIHIEITSLCEALQKDLKQFDQDSISISFVPLVGNELNQNLDQLEPSFMYTQILKEILLEMKYDEKSITELILYWRSQYSDNSRQLNIIDEFERDYNPQSSIWWYTRTYLTYYVLNRALRKLEAETIIKMSFFIRDLHQQIQQLYLEQFGKPHVEPFTVYRGQGISILDFKKLVKTKGGLISFNNFLSTSKEKEVSLLFAEGGLTKSGSVGIFFKMTIDPSISSTPFAFIDNLSYFKIEQEILFSMHTVFRIGEIKKLDNNKELYEVELKLTSDIDEQFRTVTECIRQETKGSNGWERLGDFLIKLSRFDMAEQLHSTLLDQASDNSKKGKIYNQFGRIKRGQGDFKEALSYYKKALESFERNVPLNDLDLAATYNNIGSMHMTMVECSTALSFHEKAIEIFEKTLPSNHPDLSNCYHNIGRVYDHMGEYSKALSFFEKALQIQQKTLPPIHPLLASSYNNLGTMNEHMGEYSKALLFYEKATNIQQKTLPPNHPDLASSYNNIGRMYTNMGDYSKAYIFHEKASEICARNLPPNHPSLATSYHNIASVYKSMGAYSKALSFYEKALKIQHIALPPNHPSLAIAFNNMGTVYENMGDYVKAISCCERAVDIMKKSLPPNHHHLRSCMQNLENLKNKSKVVRIE